MNPLVSVIPGVIIGIGLAVVLAGLLPVRPALGAALDRLGSTTPTQHTAGQSVEVRVGTWVHRQLPDLRFFTIPAKDLALVGTPVTKYLYDKTLLAVVGLLAPLLFGFAMQAIGVLPFWLPGAVGIPLAIALWFAPDQDLHAKARDAREEFSRSVAVYLELVAAERRRGAPAGRALTSAAEIGNTWVFARLRQELSRASYAGVAPWDALRDFSEEIGVPELGEVGNIVRLAGEEGASTYETLRAKGKSLRVQLLNNEHTKANQASERMKLPIIFSAAIFVAIVLTPLVMNLFTA
ncbi:type II secretion system F family protein [Microbacterium sp. B2969]|uniref:Type II secretion system F family protein n=1 Tax=Microbacterium alkaliflavum TaxID=3248839 RepID=A0ABW7QFW9_9MICO